MDTIWSMQLHPNRAKDFPPETFLIDRVGLIMIQFASAGPVDIG